MQDAQVPTDPEDGASDPPRRAGLRLRDTEAVATARRDMFGDGSLLDSLVASPGAPGEAAGHTDAAAPAQPAAPPPGEGPAASAEPVQHPQFVEPAPAESAQGGGPGESVVAQPLDAIIDSFESERPAGADRPDGAAPDAASAAAAPPMGIASLFDSFRLREVAPVEEPPVPGTPAPDLDMSMLELGPGGRPEPGETAPPVADALPVEPPAFIHPGSQPADIQASDAPAPDSPAADEDQDAGLDLDMSMLERKPARPVLQQEPEPEPERDAYAYGDSRPATANGEIEVYEPHAVEPPSPASEPPAEPYGAALYGSQPPGGDAAGSSPFSAWPPRQHFADRPEAPSAHSSFDPAVPPDPAELRRAASPPPFIDPGAMPMRRFSGAPEPEPDPRYDEPTAPAAFHGLVEPVNDQLPPEPIVTPAEPETRSMFDASYKIAAEAQATAEALENLKRLLASPDPDPQMAASVAGPQEAVPAPGHARLRPNLRAASAPFPMDGPAALIPMPMQEAAESGRFSGIYVLGFLTGLGLSMIAGMALYLLINIM